MIIQGAKNVKNIVKNKLINEAILSFYIDNKIFQRKQIEYYTFNNPGPLPNIASDYDDLVFTISRVENPCNFCQKTKCNLEVEIPFEIVNQKKALVFRDKLKCYFSEDKNYINCSTAKIPSEKTKRGDVLRAKLREINRYSNPISIANHNYVFIKINRDNFGNSKEQFNFYLEKAEDLDQTIFNNEKDARDIFYNRTCLITYEDIEKEKLASSSTQEEIDMKEKNCIYELCKDCIHKEECRKQKENEIKKCIIEKFICDKSLSGDFIVRKLGKCAQNFGENWNKDFDRLIGVKNYYSCDEESLGFTVLNYLDRVITTDEDSKILAHEIGHTYELADEYSIFYYYFYFYKAGKPKNKYPWCCFKQLKDGLKAENIKPEDFEKYTKDYDLGNNCWPINPIFNINYFTSSDFDCAGMPLDEKGNIVEPQNKQNEEEVKKALAAPYRSIMGAIEKDILYRYPPDAPSPLRSSR